MAPDPAWTALVAAALEGAHHERFAGLPPALIERARASQTGRRLLLQQLLPQAPRLFSCAEFPSAELLRRNPWALWKGERLRGAAADLGALALSPALRGCVDRASVLRLRQAISAARFAFALGFKAWPAQIPQTIEKIATRALSKAIDDPAAIAALIIERGSIELIHHADRLHPLLGERVRLVFRAEPNDEAAWLPAASVARYLALREEDVASAEEAVAA